MNIVNVLHSKYAIKVILKCTSLGVVNSAGLKCLKISLRLPRWKAVYKEGIAPQLLLKFCRRVYSGHGGRHCKLRKPFLSYFKAFFNNSIRINCRVDNVIKQLVQELKKPLETTQEARVSKFYSSSCSPNIPRARLHFSKWRTLTHETIVIVRHWCVCRVF